MTAGLDPAAVADLLRRTRTDRGLPAVVEDPAALRRIARLIRDGAR